MSWFRYRLHDSTGDDRGLIEHPAPNLEPGDVVILDSGEEALVTARVDAVPAAFIIAALRVLVLSDRGQGGLPQAESP